MNQMQCPKTLNNQKAQSFQRSNSKTFDVSDQCPSQLKLHKQWEEEMERLNSKYNLDCFSDSELHLEWDKGGKNINMNMVMRHSFNENNYAVPEEFKMYFIPSVSLRQF